MFILRRSDHNPILSPLRANSWEAAASFNPSPTEYKGKRYIVYRALSEPDPVIGPNLRFSSIAVASSKDGIHYDKRSVLIAPGESIDRYGAEDPRVTKIDDTFFIFYTALGGIPFSAENIKVACALSKDLVSITEKHLVTPFNAKAMALFPEKINGRYAGFVTINTDKKPADICYVEFDTVEDMWNEERWTEWYKNSPEQYALPLRRRDDDHIELGSAPIKTDKGWLVVYSHIQHYGTDHPVFGVEVVLLDLTHPQKIIGRTTGSIMVPEEYYEKIGMMRNIIFPSGARIVHDTLEIYYGASDTHCAFATVSLSRLLDSMLLDTSYIVRYEKNPILKPRDGKDFESLGIINPAAIELRGKIYLIYRAVAQGNVSTFGCAITTDGFTIDEQYSEPIYRGKASFEINPHSPFNCGAEDPRVVEIGKRLYFTYTAYNGTVARVAVISIATDDFLARKFDTWSEPHVISPDYIDDKDSCIFPQKYDGAYVVFHRIGTNVCADFVDSLEFKHPIIRCIEIFTPRYGMWDSKKVGIACPPVKTKKGWLLFYHGISEDNVYRVGAVLLDLKNPTQVIGRTATPLFEPKEHYELFGIVSSVVFPCGIIQRGDTLFLYYGAADFVVGVATCSLKKILSLFD